LLAKYTTEKFKIDDGQKDIDGWLLRPFSKKDDSETIIFSPGRDQTSKDMMPYAENAVEHGYNGVIFNYRELGEDQSELLSKRRDLELVVRFVKKLDYVAENNIVLLGEDFGAVISVVTVNDIPNEISKMVLMHPEFNFMDQFAYDSLNECNIPVLVLQGDMDHVVPLESTKKALELYPNAELKVFKGAGHEFLGEYRNQAIKTIDEFLK